jgi:hypothetical protein
VTCRQGRRQQLPLKQHGQVSIEVRHAFKLCQAAFRFLQGSRQQQAAQRGAGQTPWTAAA